MQRRQFLVLRAGLLLAMAVLGGCAEPPAPPVPTTTATLLTGATIVDGSGAPGFVGDVRIVAERIADVGTLQTQAGDVVIDAAGLTLTPGFIDSHSHHDAGAFAESTLTAATSQGITTIVVGQDGFSNYPLRAYLDKLDDTPLAVNLASYAGHNTLRGVVLDIDAARAAMPEETARMQTLLNQELAAGAFGLSTGLEYDTGIYSATDEIIALAETAAAAGGRYSSHIRSEDRMFWQALDEAIEIGATTGIPVHVSHIKLAMRSIWHRAHEVIARLDAARAQGVDVTADIYPYEYWMSTMEVLLPERDFEDLDAVRFALEELAPPETIHLVRYLPDPELEGLTITAIAERNSRDPATTYSHLLIHALDWAAAHPDAEMPQAIVASSMTEADITELMRWPYSNVCSDGGMIGHPRGHGAFTRVLGRHVREQPHLSLEEAVRKMSGLAATNTGIPDRGLIAPGYFADLVLLDPVTVIDNATITEPTALSTGISAVWVNGVLVFNSGQATGDLPGRALRHHAVEAVEAVQLR